MKKVLKGELISLAHSVLQLKDTEEITALKQKAALLYEKLCVLEYAEKHFAGPQPSIGKNEFVAFIEDELRLKETASAKKEDEKLENINFKVEASEKEFTPNVSGKEVPKELKSAAAENKASEEISNQTETVEEKQEEPSTKEEANSKIEEDFGVHFDELPQFEAKEAKEATETEEASKENEDAKTTTETEAKITSKHVTETNEEKPIPEEETSKVTYQEEKNITVETALEKRSYSEKKNLSFEAPQKTMDLFSQDKKSLNDQLRSSIKIGLNDRIAFVKHLFDNNPNEYNDALSKLNSFSNQEDALNFIQQDLKPAHEDWQDKEEIENRFVELVTGRFN